MADNRTAWIAILHSAKRRQEIYSGLIVKMDISLGQVQAMLSPSGEATDQMLNIGVDLSPVAGSRATKDVMAAVKMVAPGDHNRAVAQIAAARTTLSRAHTHSMMILARIQRAIDEIGSV
jgi:hypothetical protein